MKTLTIAVTALALSGCATEFDRTRWNLANHQIENPQIEVAIDNKQYKQSDLAIISTIAPGGVAWIQEVDGKAIHIYDKLKNHVDVAPDVLFIMPGLHKIKIGTESYRAFEKRSAETVFNANLIAGYTYIPVLQEAGSGSTNTANKNGIFLISYGPKFPRECLPSELRRTKGAPAMEISVFYGLWRNCLREKSTPENPISFNRAVYD